MTLDQLGDIVNEIRSDVKSLKHDRETDYKLLHGNGRPGLIENFNDLNKSQGILESNFKEKCISYDKEFLEFKANYDSEIRELKQEQHSNASVITSIIAHLITFATAVLAYFS